MRKLLRNKFFVGFMSLLALLLIAKDFVFKPRSGALVAEARSTETAPLVPGSGAAGLLEFAPLAVESRLTNWPSLFHASAFPRDPFARSQPAVKAAASIVAPPARPPVERLTLQAISIDADQSFAVINRRILRTGDVVEEFTVASIARGEVLLRHKLGEVRLQYRARLALAPTAAPAAVPVPTTPLASPTATSAQSVLHPPK